MTRKEHLDWCKKRAHEYADDGDRGNAVASMISDLGKWEGDVPLYDAATLRLLLTDVMMFRHSIPAVKNWIDGFN